MRGAAAVARPRPGAAAIAAALLRRGLRNVSPSSLLFAALVAAAALLLRARRERRRRARGLPPLPLRHHPLVAWALENGAIWGVTAACVAAVPPPRQGSKVSVFRYLFAQTFLMVQGLMVFNSLYANVVYAGVPNFRGITARPAFTLRGVFRDWLTCNLPADLFTAALFAGPISALPAPQFQHAFVARDFSLLPFLGKMALTRACVDIGFYAGHRAIHHPRLYWLHRRHHEHRHPSLATNYHFSATDVFIEAVLPMMFSQAVMEGLGIKASRFESALFLGYIGWHEQGSHCGKPLPTITYFPLLSPLYQSLFGDVDDANVRHHDMHHSLLTCNYGITVWPDVVMGTCRPAKPFFDAADESDPADEDARR